ncbi:MAG: L-fucose:H+ symporter permease [Planctomycetia bacterium]|nr:L-fucose:H+ symporter permease [Planctomycetia bacterium]
MSSPLPDGVSKHTAVSGERVPVVARSVLFPFILLTTLFAWWGLANNMTDTLLPAFKKIMSFDDGKTAWIQVVCYALGYGCFAIPGAIFMKRFSYKSGVLLGLGMFVLGTLLFFPSKFFFQNSALCYFIYLGSIMITFGGLSVLETACNPYICAMGDPATATQRLNFSQSFNPLGSIAGVVLSQIFILSQLNPLTAEDRAKLTSEKLAEIQYGELSAISLTYVSIGLILLLTWIMIFFTKMPNLREEDKSVDFWGTWRRLFRNSNYVCGVGAQFFYVGAQIACWSFTVRYCMVAFNLEELASTTPELLRSVDPIGAFFYNCCDKIGFTVFIPRTAEQAGATYYIFSLILFVGCRFICTGLMRFIRPAVLLTVLSGLAAILCVFVSQFPGIIGVYSLIGVSGCMSLMFPTIFSMGTSGLGDDTKMGGAGMVMAICGAALLTQMQGSLSDHLGTIAVAYLVPAAAFAVITVYAIVVCGKRPTLQK